MSESFSLIRRFLDFFAKFAHWVFSVRTEKDLKPTSFCTISNSRQHVEFGHTWILSWKWLNRTILRSQGSSLQWWSHITVETETKFLFFLHTSGIRDFFSESDQGQMSSRWVGGLKEYWSVWLIKFTSVCVCACVCVVAGIFDGQSW